MSRTIVERKAIVLLHSFEREGKHGGSVTIEGKKIELASSTPNTTDEFQRIDMRHDKAFHPIRFVLIAA